MTESGTFETDTLGTEHWAAIVLAAITGVVHLVLGVRGFPSAFGISFVLAGLGFFGAILLFLLNVRRRLLYLIGIPFTGIQFVLYFVLNWPDVVAPAGIGDKVVQLLLIVLLIRLYRREEDSETAPGAYASQ